MKSGWTTKKLGEVCEEIRERISSADVPLSAYITTDNMLKNCAGVCEAENLPPKICSLVTYRPGDILLSNIRPYLKKIWLADRNGGASSDVIVLRPISENAFPRYVYRVLARDEFFDYSMQNVTGAKMPRGKRDWIKSFDIPIPPLAEQKRIVAKIDSAFEKIDRLKANAEKNLANAKELFQSALDEAMRPKPGWVEKRLGEVCVLKNGYTPKKYDLKETGDIPYYRISAMNFPENVRTMNKPTAWLNGQWRTFEKGAIIFPKNGGAAYTGKIRMLSCDSVVDLNTGVCIPMSEVSNEYLYYWFHSFDVKTVIVEGTIPFVDFGKMADLFFAVPPPFEQRRIVDEIRTLSRRIETLQQNYSQQIADCAEMRQAILREAFEGKI